MNASFKVSKATWTGANLISNLTALMTKVNAYGYRITSLYINGPTEYVFTLTDIPSRSNFIDFEAEIDALISSGGITLEGMTYGEI